MVPRVGQKIGPYEILGRLGSGGMGLVFSAWDERLHRDVAIKLLKDEFLNPTMRSRFLGEARAASRLNHSNICTIFDIGEEQDCPYMVMELLKGDTLRSRMQKGPLPLDVVIQVATQVADALSVAHAQGVVHRDIKPANVVLVDKSNATFQTKVLDFGLAKVDLEGHGSGLTTTGMTVGTVSYMSPEQARGELLDGRSDLFSLGILLYEMTTGKLPFDGATSALVFVQLLNHPPEPLRTLNASVPRAFEQVINKCLQKDRANRYQTGQELVSALHKAALTLNSEERTSTWLSKFALGLKRESSSASQSEVEPEQLEVPQETSASLQMTSEEAFLRPFKPVRKSGEGSQRYSPINGPYSGSARDAMQENAAEDTVSQADATDAVVSSGIAHETAASAKTSVWTAEPVEAPSHDDLPLAGEDAPTARGPRVLLGSLLAAVLLVITVAVVLSKRQHAIVLHAPSMVLAAISNHTGDSGLADVLSAGLDLSLGQSSWLSFQDDSVQESSSDMELPKIGDPRFLSLQQFAKASGASTFALAEMHIEGNAYSFSVRVFDTVKGVAVGSATSSALSRERIPGAIDSLAVNLRSSLGESAESIRQASAPLSQVATGNMDALSAYALGGRLLAQVRLLDAVHAYEHAANIDPQFTQTNLRLAEIYIEQHAESSAEAAAAKVSAAHINDEHTKMLAAGLKALALDDLQNAERAFQGLTRRNGNDFHAYIWLSMTQRLQGNFSGALASAQEAVRLSPASDMANRALSMALVAMDHTDNTSQTEEPQQSHRSSADSGDQLRSFLAGTIPAASQNAGSRDFATQITQAQLLDATGQFNAGMVLWRTIVEAASSAPEFTSTAAYALAQGALDHALLSDCGPALAMTKGASAYPIGPEGTFALGMASGLCGDTSGLHAQITKLQAVYPQSTRVAGYYTSDLNALMQIRSGGFADALVTLQSADHFDSVSFNAYLRGQAYLLQKKPQPATVELQALLRHPGQVALVSPEMLPSAELSLGRAFAANGDAGNTAQAYGKLLSYLRQADADNPALAEARLATIR